MCLHISSVFLLSFLFWPVCGSWLLRNTVQYKCLCYWRPERGGKGLKVEKEGNLACNQVIVVVNCSVCCTVEQKLPCFYLRSVHLWLLRLGQSWTGNHCMFPGQAVLFHFALAWFLVSSVWKKPILSSNGFTSCQGHHQLAKHKIPPHPTQELRQPKGRMWRQVILKSVWCLGWHLILLMKTSFLPLPL